MKVDLNAMTRRFILGEGKERINPHALLESLTDILDNIKVSRKVDHNRLHLGKRHVREIKRSFRRLQEQINTLEERIQVLDEISSVGGGALTGHVDNTNMRKEKKDD